MSREHYRQYPVAENVSLEVRELFRRIDAFEITEQVVADMAELDRSTLTNWRLGKSEPRLASYVAVMRIVESLELRSFELLRSITYCSVHDGAYDKRAGCRYCRMERVENGKPTPKTA